MSTTGHENEAIKVSGLKKNEKKLVNLLPFNEVVCSTAGGTAAKVANTTPTSFNLVARAMILVRFTYGISVANATFKVGNFDAKPIYYKGAALPAGLINAGMTVLMRYDGTNFNILGYLCEDKEDVIGKGTCSTAAATAAKAVTVSSNWVLKENALLVVKFANAITVANATLSVNSGAAKPIYNKGAALEANIIPEGAELLIRYDGTNYNIVGGAGDGTPEVEIGSTTPTEDVKIFVDESEDPASSINVYQEYEVDAMIANTVHLTAQTLTNTQKTQARTNIGAASQADMLSLTSYARKTDFDLAVLQQAVAEGNLEKYGLKVGDQKTINGHTYVIAGLNPMKGTTTPKRLTQNHVGLIVIPHTTQAWNASGNTYTGADGRGAGYKNSDLHYYLKNTVLPMCNTDLGASNLLGQPKILSNAVNQSGINRFGEASGCSSSWDWESDCKICALSEVQVYGAAIWSSSGYDTGEACRQLEVFQKYSHTEIFGDEYPWLRDVVSASNAAYADCDGDADYRTADYAWCVAALILFH